VDQPWLVQTSVRLLELITASATANLRASAWPQKLLDEVMAQDRAFAQWMAFHDLIPSGDAAASSDLRHLWPAFLAALTKSISATAGNSASSQASSNWTLEQRAMHLVAIAARGIQPEPASNRDLPAAHGSSLTELAYDLAYGLSHELNNPLANIATRARLLAETESDLYKRGLLEAIVDQAMRGCEMIADLMTVARPPLWTDEKFDLVPLVHKLQDRASSWTTARGLTLECNLPQTAVHLKGDPQAVGEALWALLRNAMEVAQQTIVIEVTVVAKAGAAPADANTSRNGSRETAGPWVTVSIFDDGPGLSDIASQRAFHPYFSGREAGRGLGLGLSKAQRIAAHFGGHARLQSRATGGCQACWSVPIAGSV